MYWDERDLRYFKKIYANVLARKTPYFRRPLTINHQSTNIKIIKVNKNYSYLEKFGGLSTLHNHLCYLIQHAKKIDTFLFNCHVDIIATDIAHHVVDIFTDVAPNNILHFSKNAHNIWIFTVGAINFFQIKIQDLVYTH
ncbi:MAG: hypothetical protein LBP70_01135 [Mycoplasmataceae bacterium]|nr:hypothetical protein [Mycoplasmataceae bacterium]